MFIAYLIDFFERLLPLMSTLEKLVDDGHVVKIDGDLDDDELPQRYLYILREAIPKMNSLLATGEPKHSRMKIPLNEQADALFYDFCVGNPLSYELGVPGFNNLKVVDEGIWELKQDDLRFFGWFYKKDTFIITDVVHAERLKATPGFYAGYAGQAARRRHELDLDPPKYLPQKQPEYVISNFDYPRP